MWQIFHDIGAGLKGIGLNESTATAGLLGGTVRGLIIQGGWVNGIVSALVGAITANYMASGLSISTTFNPWSWSEGTIGFIVGMTAMLLCEGILKYARDWSADPKLPGGRP
jgi:hypothetical protein